jgi:hypothetical protein
VGGGAPDARVIERMERPAPPDHLTDEQAEEWTQIVERLPADWFPRETHDLLANYCAHVISARRLRRAIEEVEDRPGDLDVDYYDRLLKMREREVRSMSSLGTRMRLTQQATYDKSKGKGSGGKRKPWELDG